MRGLSPSGLYTGRLALFNIPLSESETCNDSNGIDDGCGSFLLGLMFGVLKRSSYHCLRETALNMIAACCERSRL